MDLDEDSDEETELRELNELTAVLEADKISENESSSLYSSSVPSTSSFKSSDTRKYVKVEAAIALNKLYDEKLFKLEKILVTRLNECRQKLSEIHGIDPATDKEDKEVFRYIRCGKPYFKDTNNFPAPSNQDTILMAESNMYNFSDMTTITGWTLKDKKCFINVIEKMSRQLKERELTSKLAQLKRDIKVIDCKSLQKEMKMVKAEISMLHKKTLGDLALSIDEEYDWDAVANELNHRHSAQEYRSLWKLYLHPSVNKNSWTKKEHLTLQEIAQANNFQDWDSIAKELGTGRTGYQCFVYFRTNMSNTFTGQKWTKEEEMYLKRLIEYYKEDEYIPWGKVAASIENRTKVQIYNKYFRLLEERKGRFLPEEDAVILTCIENYGRNYKKIAEFLPGRSATQLRMRYQVLSKRISAVWTVEEDRKLIQLMANKELSLNYSTMTNHFPGKDRFNIRTRYLTLVKWMKKYPNKDFRQAPRRGARRLGHGSISENLNKALENLKQRMQTEVEKKKSKKITIDSSEVEIDDAIIATLANENRKEDLKREPMNENYVQMAEFVQSSNGFNLKKILILLRAKLKKEYFKNSYYAREIPGLLETEQDNKFITIRSYSRKSTKTFTVEGTPDIWGTVLDSTPEYVLPPHLSTITGCRKLMDYVSRESDDMTQSINLNLLSRRNSLLQEQIFNLMERFNTLFVWPMMLSNQGPPLPLIMQSNNGENSQSIHDNVPLQTSKDAMIITEEDNINNSIT